MSETSADQHAPSGDDREPDQPVRYPTNHVLAVLDTEEQLADVAEALLAGGFLDSEVHVSCGSTEADRVRASTGRSGLAGLATRLAERLGIENVEMEVKSHYEQAMRDGHYVLRVAAPTEERKDVAARILRDHGAHSVSFLGRFAIEGLVPPSAS